MNRKLSWLFTAILLVSIHRAEAQQTAKLRRVGILRPGLPPQKTTAEEPFRQALRDLGYIEGQNISFEYRWARVNTNVFLILLQS